MTLSLPLFTALIPYQTAEDVLLKSLTAWRKEQVPHGITFYSIPKARGDEPTIVYLKGTSCSGKNRFADAFKTGDSWTYINDDIIAYDLYLKAIQQRFPKEYAAANRAIPVCNLYHAFRYKETLFTQGATETDCTAAKDALQSIQKELDSDESRPWVRQINRAVRSDVLGKVQAALLAHRNVLLDSWFFTASQVHAEFPKARVVRLMLYCPLQIAYKRMFKRNREGAAMGNIVEKRYPINLVPSFTALFCLQQKPEQPIEVIDKTSLLAHFTLFREEVEKANGPSSSKNFTIEPLTLASFEALQNDFLAPYQTAAEELLSIAPKEPQHIVVTNSDALEKIRQAIEKRLFT